MEMPEKERKCDKMFQKTVSDPPESNGAPIYPVVSRSGRRWPFPTTLTIHFRPNSTHIQATISATSLDKSSS